MFKSLTRLTVFMVILGSGTLVQAACPAGYSLQKTMRGVTCVSNNPQTPTQPIQHGGSWGCNTEYCN